MDIEDIEVFIGIDVGKSEHWATALSREGRKILDRALPNDEDRLREVYQRLQAKGQVLVVVDQPATIGALAVAVAQDMGITVGYLPGLSMRRIADLTPGSAKTDAKDAAVIAGAARSMPHTLRAVSASDENAAALSMLTGFDLDLARQVNQSANRIRGLFTQIHPALEAVLGPWLEHDAILEVITAWPTPADLKRAGKARIDAKLKAHGCRRHTTWAGQIVSALELLNRPGFDGGSDDTEGSLSWDRRSTPMNCGGGPRGWSWMHWPIRRGPRVRCAGSPRSWAFTPRLYGPGSRRPRATWSEAGNHHR